MRVLARPQATAVAGPTVAAATGRPTGSTAAAGTACQPCSRVLRPRQPRRGCSLAAGSSLDEAAAAAAAASSERSAADAVQPAPSGSQAADFASQEDLTADYLQHCQQEYGKPGLVEFAAGAGGLPKAVLMHPSGARCELYLHGGVVASWRHADGREMLHLREGNAFDGVQPISGGVQIAWPQYGVGDLPTHGFLQDLHWSVVETAWREPGEVAEGSEQHALDWRPSISLYAETDEEWAEAWPHRFEALYTVSLEQPDPAEPSDQEFLRQASEQYQPWVQRQRAARAGGRKGAGAAGGRGEDERKPLMPSVLRCLLQVHNSDDKPMTFSTALRTHFATRDLATHSKFVKTLGLRGKYVLDYSQSPLAPRLGVEDGHYLHFGGLREQNSLYVDCGPQGDVLFCPGSPAHFKVHNKKGFSDIGVVHPAAVVPEEARHFVQLASARAVRQVTLQPGETWAGEMVLTAHDEYWPLPAWEMEESSGVPIPDQDPEQMPTLRRRSSQAEVSLLESQGIV
ncbi:hypothetical protein ABPG75_002465 [Micractinium tetrahymenae]